MPVSVLKNPINGRAQAISTAVMTNASMPRNEYANFSNAFNRLMFPAP